MNIRLVKGVRILDWNCFIARKHMKSQRFAHGYMVLPNELEMYEEKRFGHTRSETLLIEWEQ